MPDPPQRSHSRDDEESESSLSHNHRCDKKHRHRRKKKARHRSDNDESSSSYERPRKRRKTKDRKKRSRKHNDNSSSSSEEEDSSGESYHRRRKRERKKRRKKEFKKEHRRKDRKKRLKQKQDDPRKDDDDDSRPTFGKYGILNASDLPRMRRSFEAWMAEIKGIANFNGPKWELQKYFDEYREDFNTATLPHQKYYDYDAWEVREHENQKARQAELSSKSVVRADEAQHQALMRRRAAQQERAALDLVKSSMSREKVKEMKHQSDLRAQMQIAFKMGDKKTYERLKERLAADE